MPALYCCVHINLDLRWLLRLLENLEVLRSLATDEVEELLTGVDGGDPALVGLELWRLCWVSKQAGIAVIPCVLIEGASGHWDDLA